MKISATDVAYVAELANLDVPEEEREALAKDLSRIVAFVEQLNTLDTEDIKPTSQVITGQVHAEREDRVEPRIGSGEAAKTDGLFKVPRVISER